MTKSDNNDLLVAKKNVKVDFIKRFQAIQEERGRVAVRESTGYKWKIAGATFKVIRFKLGNMLQEDFAKLLCVSKTTLSNWELGIYRPAFLTLVAIKYQLNELGEVKGLKNIGDLIKYEDFGYTSAGQKK